MKVHHVITSLPIVPDIILGMCDGQVQVPSSGTETVECGVCQHPFLVSA
jgi:hypothetical protein